MIGLQLTLTQRLNIEALCQRQRQKAGDYFLTLVELWRKTRLTDEERSTALLPACPSCGVHSRVNVAKAAITPAVGVQLEQAEGRRLASLLDAYDQLTVADSDWFIPLHKQLKAQLTA